MEKSLRTFEITMETIETRVVGKRGDLLNWCLKCEKETKTLVPEEAACVLDTTTRDIYRAIEEGRLHFIETACGRVFVCVDSIEQELL